MIHNSFLQWFWPNAINQQAPWCRAFKWRLRRGVTKTCFFLLVCDCGLVVSVAPFVIRHSGSLSSVFGFMCLLQGFNWALWNASAKMILSQLSLLKNISVKQSKRKHYKRWKRPPGCLDLAWPEWCVFLGPSLAAVMWPLVRWLGQVGFCIAEAHGL